MLHAISWATCSNLEQASEIIPRIFLGDLLQQIFFLRKEEECLLQKEGDLLFIGIQEYLLPKEDDLH